MVQNELYLISSANHTTGDVRNDFHHHNEYELIFVEKGTACLQVGQKSYTVGKDSLIFLANLEQHSLTHCSEDYTRYCITLHVSATDSCIQTPELINLLKNHTDSFPHCLNVTSIRQQVQEIFDRLIECRREAPFSNELSACYLTALLIFVLRLYPGLQESAAASCRSRILAVQKYLDQHFREPLRINDICRQHFISNHYLSHQFKELTGYSPKQYLTLLRLKHAAILIHDTADPVNEIAFSCGFSDINNFCKQFKREYGCTPTAFRSAQIG